MIVLLQQMGRLLASRDKPLYHSSRPGLHESIWLISSWQTCFCSDTRFSD